MAITLKDFQEFVQGRMAKGFAHPEQLRDRVKEIFDFAIANESSMDAETNAYFDNFLDKLASVFEQGLKQVADSPDKRRMTRLIAGAKRKHHRAETFLKNLGVPYPIAIPIVEAARPVFLDIQQSILDLLWDASQQSQKGVAQVATLGLLYWTIDELVVAFYLSERRYTTQGYAHLRTVHDLLEKSELFFKQPACVEVWASGNWKKIRKELSPGSIRKKLGKPEFDPVYGLFTELGTHGTWEALQKRVTKTGMKGDRTQIAMRIGGTPWESEIDTTIVSCIFTAFTTLLMVVMVYDTRLHQQEVVGILRARFEQMKKFFYEQFLEPCKKNGADTSVLNETLEKLLKELGAIESMTRISS